MTCAGDSKSGRSRQLAQQRSARQLEHRGQFGPLGGTEALDTAQVARAGPQQTAEAAEGLQDLLGQLQHADALQAGAQQQRDQFDIGERTGSEREQAFARAGIGRQVLEHGRSG